MNIHHCPMCTKPIAWTNSPFKPFCSERCKVKDLAMWSSDTYKISVDCELELEESYE